MKRFMETVRFVTFHLVLLVSIDLVSTSVAFANGSETALQPTSEERRAEELDRQIRCVVCQSESIADSQADMARDLRRLVREQIRAGATNQEILTYLRSRYGDFILLNPPFQKNTYVLWAFPVIAFLISFGAAALFYKRVKEKPPRDR